MTLDCVFFEARNLKINFCFTIFGHFGIRKWKIIIWAVSCRWNRKIGPGIVWRPTWWPVHIHNYRNGTLKIIFFAFWKFHWKFSRQNFWKNHNLKTRIERRIWIFESLWNMSIKSKFWSESKMFIYIFWQKINMLCHYESNSQPYLGSGMAPIILISLVHSGEILGHSRA